MSQWNTFKDFENWNRNYFLLFLQVRFAQKILYEDLEA